MERERADFIAEQESRTISTTERYGNLSLKSEIESSFFYVRAIGHTRLSTLHVSTHLTSFGITERLKSDQRPGRVHHMKSPIFGREMHF